MLGTSRWALLVAVVPLLCTFAFLHFHYAQVRALRQSHGAATGVHKVRAADLFSAASTSGTPVVGASRLRSLLRSSDQLERPLRDGCDLAAPAAVRASALAHSHARALFSRNDFGGLLARDLGSSGEGALIGVGGGAFMDALLGIWNASTLHLVDAWRHQPGLGPDSNNVRNEEQETLLSETYSRLNSHDARRYKVLRETSAKAVFAFADCSLDFIYIDGRRDYQGVLMDLIDYWPKLKPGGILAGHDYLDGQLPEGGFGVKTAADRFAQAVNRMVFATQVRALCCVRARATLCVFFFHRPFTLPPSFLPRAAHRAGPSAAMPQRSGAPSTCSSDLFMHRHP